MRWNARDAAASCKSIPASRYLPVDFKRIIRVDSSDRCGTVRMKPESRARVVRGRRVTGLARSRRPLAQLRSAAQLHAGRVATLCRKTANHCHSLPFSASYLVRPFESFISSPVAGVPASLGPGLRTVSGASRRPDGSSPSRAGLHFVERPTKNGAPSQIGGSMNARGNASRCAHDSADTRLAIRRGRAAARENGALALPRSAIARHFDQQLAFIARRPWDEPVLRRQGPSSQLSRPGVSERREAPESLIATPSRTISRGSSRIIGAPPSNGLSTSTRGSEPSSSAP